MYLQRSNNIYTLTLRREIVLHHDNASELRNCLLFIFHKQYCYKDTRYCRKKQPVHGYVRFM